MYAIINNNLQLIPKFVSKLVIYVTNKNNLKHLVYAMTKIIWINNVDLRLYYPSLLLFKIT